jgi:hypothetical protein
MRQMTHCAALQNASCDAESAYPPGAFTLMSFAALSASLTTWYSGPS